jgi:Na+-transporting NADH:ubiquinone oxidoreductase subunit C
MQNDSTAKTIIVAVALCVVCSVIVSTAAVKLRDKQAENASLDVKKNLLLAAGMIDNPKASKSEILGAFGAVESKVIDLKTGKILDMDPEQFDNSKARKDPRYREVIAGKSDIAKIKYRSKLAKVYLVRSGGRIDQVVLPIYGKGLWSTMYGFLSLKGDTRTVQGIGFYSHGETPGLGGEIDNPSWKASWGGKKLLDGTYKPVLDIVKGSVDPASASAERQIDGLSGATITSQGVESTINYWLGENGYGPFLAILRAGGV